MAGDAYSVSVVTIHASDWRNTSALSCNTTAKLEHECKIVTQVQIIIFSKTTNFTCPTGS